MSAIEPPNRHRRTAAPLTGHAWTRELLEAVGAMARERNVDGLTAALGNSYYCAIPKSLLYYESGQPARHKNDAAERRCQSGWK